MNNSVLKVWREGKCRDISHGLGFDMSDFETPDFLNHSTLVVNRCVYMSVGQVIN